MEYFWYIFILAIGFGVAFALSVRRIQFSGSGTDNELQVNAAAQSHRWKWFSDMHKSGTVKTSMKDVTILLLAVFQKILRDKRGDRPLVTSMGFTNVVSTILIYLIASNYWSGEVALLVSVLFIISLWPWQVALLGGHVNTATMMFLFSVYFIQQIHHVFPSNLWLVVSGAFLCLTLFSSSSSSKYIIPFFIALFYEKYKIFLEQGLFQELKSEILFNYSVIFNVALPLFTILFCLFVVLNYKKVVTNIYQNKSFDFLNRIIKSRNEFSLEHYLDSAKKKIKRYTLWIFRVVIFIIFLVNFIGLDYLTKVFVGFLIVFLALTLPDVKTRTIRYLRYILQFDVKSHFRVYIDFFAQRGIKVSKYTRGEGWRWAPKFFSAIMPGHVIVYLALLGYLIIVKFFQQNQSPHSIILLLLVITSLLPILWGELTKGVQLGRTYSAGIIGILMFIGYASFNIQQNYNIFWPIFLASVVPISIWNLKTYFFDVYPARMAIPNLIQALEKRNIKSFYTYKTDYNNAFVNAIDPIILKHYKIKYINNMAEIKDKNAWIVIPGTSSKAFNMESEGESIRNGDFTNDPFLNRLIETKKIEEIATEKFKTYGTSRIWVHESEVTSYRDLILHDIKEKDLFRGYAWLLHTSKIRKVKFTQY